MALALIRRSTTTTDVARSSRCCCCCCRPGWNRSSCCRPTWAISIRHSSSIDRLFPRPSYSGCRAGKATSWQVDFASRQPSSLLSPRSIYVLAQKRGLPADNGGDRTPYFLAGSISYYYRYYRLIVADLANRRRKSHPPSRSYFFNLESFDLSLFIVFYSRLAHLLASRGSAAAADNSIRGGAPPRRDVGNDEMTRYYN